MARPLRLEYAGALYHVTARGDRREDIYICDKDRMCFLSVLEHVCENFNWCCHAYCLMDNHYHLLIETPDANLSKGMRQLNGVYTQRFNRRHSRVGHVFQGRYKGILVEKQAYLLELARYIVLNPVRARMVSTASEWVWSSYRATIGAIVCPDFLTVEWLLSSLGQRKKKARERYKKFVMQGRGQPSPWESLKNQVYLGSDGFVEQHIESIDSDVDLSEVPKSQRRSKPKSLAFYEVKFCSRNEAILAAYKSGGYTQKEIGDFFDLHYSRVSRIVGKEKRKI